MDGLVNHRQGLRLEANSPASERRRECLRRGAIHQKLEVQRMLQQQDEEKRDSFGVGKCGQAKGQGVRPSLF